MAPWISTQFAKHHRAIQAQAILAPPRLAVPPPNLMMMRACGRKGCHTIWSSLAALRYWSPMTAALVLLYISAISYVGAFLFVAVDRLEPSPRLALVFKCAIV